MADSAQIYQSQYGSYVAQAAKDYGIPLPIFQALIQKESTWNPYAVGSSGEIGLTQLMPGTAKDLGVNPYDPLANIRGGAAYLSQQFKTFGNWSDALAAYNGGPGNKAAGAGYATSVLSIAQGLGYSPDASTSNSSQTGLVPKTGLILFGVDVADIINGVTSPVTSVVGTAGSVVQTGASAVNAGATLMSADFWQRAMFYIGGAAAVVALLWFGVSTSLRSATQ